MSRKFTPVAPAGSAATAGAAGLLPKLGPPVVLVAPPDPAAWNELVSAAESASIFHTSEWARLWTTHWRGAEWQALVVPAGAGYAAGLPFIVRPRPFGRAMLSMPFGTYGGPIARRDCENGAATRRRLLQAFTHIAREDRVLISDLTWHRGHSADVPFGQPVETTTTHVRPLGPDAPALFRSLPASIRSRVRQAESRGLVVARVTDDAGVEAFHALAVRALGRRGTRAKPLSLYRQIAERLVPAGLARYHLVHHGRVAIGGSIHFLHRGVATNWLTVSDERHLGLHPNHALIAGLLRELCEAGFREYDFGTSPRESRGLVEFKESWGAGPRTVLGLRHRSVLHRLLRR